MKSYKGWALLDSMPDGWVIDNTAGSPLCGHVFITNGKSVINGQERALLKIDMQKNTNVYTKKKKSSPAMKSKEFSYPKGYADRLNLLARSRFKETLLRDILADLMVCEIEGWPKKAYINELKELINSIDTES